MTPSADEQECQTFNFIRFIGTPGMSITAENKVSYVIPGSFADFYGFTTAYEISIDQVQQELGEPYQLRF